ncbi:MAG: hypothetical protein NVS9B12_12980 [Vulcanimicrobiaceae bacterium]
MGKVRAGSLLLPLIALLWLAAIYAAVLFGRPYTLDLGLGHRLIDTHHDALVVRSSPMATRLGMPKGARVLFTRMSRIQKEHFIGTQRGTPLSLVVSYKGTTRTIAVPATLAVDPETTLQRIFELTAMSFSLLLAAYLGFRLPGLMIAALIFFLGGGGIEGTPFAALLARFPDEIYLPFSALFDDLVNWFPMLALASFAVRLPGGPAEGRKRAAIIAVDVLVVAGFLAGLWNSSAHSALWATFAGALVLGACAASLYWSRPEDRGRVGIVFAAAVVGGTGYALSLLAPVPYAVGVIFFTISITLVPLSVAYAILRHRVFDVGFVLNRTIVYAISSATVLLVFAALEFATERFVSNLTHVESLALQFGIALAIIVCVRLVHGRVDRLVDSVLFRGRHEQESALRRFATTLQFYTEPMPLIRDTVGAMARYARVKAAALYVVSAAADGLDLAESSFRVAAPHVDYNDTALVEIRAHGEVLQVHDYPTAFPGERLYPMTLAGRVSGALVVSERETAEEMPPDIDDAIRHVAQSVAITLAAIEADNVRREIVSLRAQLSTST